MQFSAQIGIWTDYEQIERERVTEVIGHAGNAGLDGIEIFSQHLAYFHNAPDQLAAELATAELDLSGVYFNVDHEDADKHVEATDRHAETIATVDGDVLVVGAGPDLADETTRVPADFEAMADMLNRITERAATHGVETVLHPHRGQLIETPDDLESLLEAGLDQDAVGLCPHAVHQSAVGADPYTIYEDHADWVRYLHVSDTTEDADGDLMGEGVLDQHRLHDPLFGAGYDDWIVIEGRTDDTTATEYVDHARAYVREELAGVTKE